MASPELTPLCLRWSIPSLSLKPTGPTLYSNKLSIDNSLRIIHS